MDLKEKITVMSSPTLIIVMFGVFQLFAYLFGNDLAWYLGFLIYWPIFCLIIPILILGKEKILKTFFVMKADVITLIIVAIPVVIILVGAFIGFTMNRSKTVLGTCIWIGMSLANGIFEEIFWRALHINIFDKSIFFGLI